MRSASITQPEVRSQILSCAEALFRAHGYAKTTVADIAREQRPVSDRLRKILLEMHGFTLERYLKESSVHELCAKAMDEQWGVIEAHIQRTRALTRSLIEEGMKSGEFAKRDLDATAGAVHNAMLPFCHPQVVAENFAKDQKRQALQMGEFLVRALKA